MDDEHHGEFDANELRQHEEFTKVKNVDSVELGQYQMETWYFSPLPAEYNNCKVSLPHGRGLCLLIQSSNMQIQAPSLAQKKARICML